MRRFILTGLVCLAAAVHAQASDLAPNELIKDVTNEVLSVIRGDMDIHAGGNNRTVELIEAKVQQHFDFAHMARLALGRYWRSASPAQQKQITDEFHRLLVRVYSVALTQYQNQSVVFKPFKMNAGDSDVEVQTEVMRGDGRPISLDYFLEKMQSGWRVYDIEVDGISLVLNYRESFANEVQRVGVDGLIKALQVKNHSGTPAED